MFSAIAPLLLGGGGSPGESTPSTADQTSEFAPNLINQIGSKVDSSTGSVFNINSTPPKSEYDPAVKIVGLIALGLVGVAFIKNRKE